MQALQPTIPASVRFQKCFLHFAFILPLQPYRAVEVAPNRATDSVGVVRSVRLSSHDDLAHWTALRGFQVS